MECYSAWLRITRIHNSFRRILDNVYHCTFECNLKVNAIAVKLFIMSTPILYKAASTSKNKFGKNENDICSCYSTGILIISDVYLSKYTS